MKNLRLPCEVGVYLICRRNYDACCITDNVNIITAGDYASIIFMYVVFSLSCVFISIPHKYFMYNTTLSDAVMHAVN